MANLIPRNLWDLQAMRMPSLFEDVDELVSTTPVGVEDGISISEDAQNVYIDVAMPGVAPEEVEITYDRGLLWIRGEAQKEEEGRKFYRRAARAFSYRISVPADVDPNGQPHASCEHGILSIALPKIASPEPKRIKVNGNKKSSTKTLKRSKKNA